MMPNATSPRRLAFALAALALIVSGCGGADRDGGGGGQEGASPATAASSPAKPPVAANPPTSASAAAAVNIYAQTAPGRFAPATAGALERVYVPNTLANTVQVIDPRTYRIIGRFPVGVDPHHVVPSWDLTTLWVNNTRGDSLTPIDPRTGAPGKPVRVVDPYNLYFTPEGRFGIVMAERYNRLDVVDARTFAVQRSLPLPCHGPNHADYDASLDAFVVSCEFSGHLLVIDKEATRVVKVIDLNSIATPGATSPHEARSSHLPQSGLDGGASAMPQDVRLTPDGKYFLACDMLRNGVWVFDAKTYAFVKFIRSGKGTHSVYPSRDARRLFVSNRDEGTITVLDAATLEKTAKWTIPGGGSPDMGQLTNDGSQLWLSGRYHSEVYVFDTATGRLLHRIKTDPGPHGLTVWPQPGRFSLGHTGNMR